MLGMLSQMATESAPASEQAPPAPLEKNAAFNFKDADKAAVASKAAPPHAKPSNALAVAMSGGKQAQEAADLAEHAVDDDIAGTLQAVQGSSPDEVQVSALLLYVSEVDVPNSMYKVKLRIQCRWRCPDADLEQALAHADAFDAAWEPSWTPLLSVLGVRAPHTRGPGSVCSSRFTARTRRSSLSVCAVRVGGQPAPSARRRARPCVPGCSRGRRRRGGLHTLPFPGWWWERRGALYPRLLHAPVPTGRRHESAVGSRPRAERRAIRARSPGHSLASGPCGAQPRHPRHPRRLAALAASFAPEALRGVRAAV